MPRGRRTPKTLTRRAPAGESVGEAAGTPGPIGAVLNLYSQMGSKLLQGPTAEERAALEPFGAMMTAVVPGGGLGAATLRRILSNPKAFITSIRKLMASGKAEQALEKLSQVKKAALEAGRRATTAGARPTAQAATQAKNLGVQADKLREVARKAETVIRGGGRVTQKAGKPKPTAAIGKRPPPSRAAPAEPVSPIPQRGQLGRVGQYIRQHPGQAVGTAVGAGWGASMLANIAGKVGTGDESFTWTRELSNRIGTRRGGPDPVEVALTQAGLQAAGERQEALEAFKHLGRAQVTRRRLAETSARRAADRFEDAAMNLRRKALDDLEKGLLEYRTAHPAADMDTAVRAVAGRPLTLSEMVEPVDDEQAAVAELVKARARNLRSTGPVAPAAAQAILQGQSEEPLP